MKDRKLKRIALMKRIGKKGKKIIIIKFRQIICGALMILIITVLSSSQVIHL